MMRLCYIADISSVHIQRWIRFFIERGHDVSVITDVPATVPGAQVYNIGACLPPFQLPGVSAVYQILAKVSAIRRLLRRIQPDLIHGHYATNYGFLAALSGFQPLVQTVHGSDILVDAVGSREKRWFVRHALKRATHITAPAEHMTRRLDEIGIPRERILILQYGVDTTQFAPSDDSAVRQAHRVVSTRMFDWKYNVDQLVHAAPALSSLYPDVEIVLAGDGPDRDALQELAHTLKVETVVRFVGRVLPESMPTLLQSATVYVSTSVTDGSSLSLLEAMACGAFPVVTDIPANREWITDGENGFLVRVGDVEALADRIAQGLTNDVLRTAAVCRNAELIRERGDYRINMVGIEHLYEQIVSAKSVYGK